MTKEDREKEELVKMIEKVTKYRQNDENEKEVNLHFLRKRSIIKTSSKKSGRF